MLEPLISFCRNKIDSGGGGKALNIACSSCILKQIATSVSLEINESSL